MKKHMSIVSVLLLVVIVLGVMVAGAKARSPTDVVVDPWAVVDVTHYAWSGSAYDIPVEPDTGEHWTVTARWTYGALSYYEYGSLDVDWNGSSWVISNAGTTSNIFGYNICDGAECGSQLDPHGYGYRLQAGVNTAVPPYGIYSVTFTVSSVDDGYTLTGTPCDYDTAVSNPEPYVYGAIDYAPFEINMSCSNTGTSLSIPYEYPAGGRGVPHWKQASPNRECRGWDWRALAIRVR